MSMTTRPQPLGFLPAGTTVDHPDYGQVTIVRPLDRGPLTNVAGFPPGVVIRLASGAEKVVYARRFVTVRN